MTDDAILATLDRIEASLALLVEISDPDGALRSRARQSSPAYARARQKAQQKEERAQKRLETRRAKGELCVRSSRFAGPHVWGQVEIVFLPGDEDVLLTEGCVRCGMGKDKQLVHEFRKRREAEVVEAERRLVNAPVALA